MSLTVSCYWPDFSPPAIAANDVNRASPHRAPPPELCPVTLTVRHVVWHGHGDCAMRHPTLPLTTRPHPAVPTRRNSHERRRRADLCTLD
jgi:hypothetical protein